MTLQYALKNLDKNGEQAAKRPSMNGYVYLSPIPAEAEDGQPTTWEVRFVAKDGSAMAFTVDKDWKVIGGEGFTVDAAFIENAVLADDWETASREKLEAARRGDGRW